MQFKTQKRSLIKYISLNWPPDSISLLSCRARSVTLTQSSMKDSAESYGELVAKQPLFACSFPNVSLSHAAHSATFLNFCTNSQCSMRGRGSCEEMRGLLETTGQESVSSAL